MTKSIHPIVLEEIDLLATIVRIIEENPRGFDNAEQDLIDQLIVLRNDVLDAKDEDLPTFYAQMDQLNSSLDSMKAMRGQAEVDPSCPYFAHLRLKERGRVRDVYLGKATNLDNGLQIVDWRNAPISKLFYLYSEGDDYEEFFGDQQRDGEVLARRIVNVHNGTLLRVSNSESTWVKQGSDWNQLSKERIQLAGGQGASLRAGSPITSQLGAGGQLRSNKHLPDIAALIDPEQFELISAEQDGIMVIRGSAGSGKTTVALHRLSYLTFENPQHFAPKKMMFMVWGKAMRDYVGHVLPHLGVSGLKVQTWKSWSQTVFRQHFPKWPALIDDPVPDAVRRVKLHPKTMRRLRDYISETPQLPRDIDQVYQDWAHILTDFGNIRGDLRDVWTMSMQDRAESWLSHQTDLMSIFHEGTRHEEDEHAFLDLEDISLLLYAYQLRVGPLKKKNREIALSHLVIDEVQDFSPLEILILLGVCDDKQSVTLAGDTRQHISKSAGFSSWSEFLDQVGVHSTALSTLQVAYRSTKQIVDFALGLLTQDEQQDEPTPLTVKEGPPVEFFQFSDHGACVAFLAEELRRLQVAEPRANVALVTPSMELSETYYDGLSKCEIDPIRLVTDQNFAFAPGIDVVDVEQVKGLEFDYVVIIEANAFAYPDTPHHQRLLHVAATRAVHQLWLTCVGTSSPLLPEVLRDVH